jgi:hypothetical protein
MEPFWEEDLGPIGTGGSFTLLPKRCPRDRELRDLVKTALKRHGKLAFDTQEHALVYSKQGQLSDVLTNCTCTFAGRLLLFTSSVGVGSTLSQVLDDHVLQFGNGFQSGLWTGFAFRSGHLVSRHCQSPETQFAELGLGEILEESMDGREVIAAKAMAATRWTGDPLLFAEALGLEPGKPDISAYFRKFGEGELESIRAGPSTGRAKANPSDRYSTASHWAYLSLLANCGYPGIETEYWNLSDPAAGDGAPIYTLGSDGYEIDQALPDCSWNLWDDDSSHPEGCES